jgi:Holliday junction DNA helicase RuvB
MEISSSYDRAIRPKSFSDFAGQHKVVNILEVSIHSAKSRGDVLDHVILSGPPGLGKTTLSEIISNEMGSNITVVNSPSIKSKGELASVLTSMKRGDILFLDEIHSLDNKIEEILYPAMEDFKLEVIAGNRAVTIHLEPFTLVGATTRLGKLQAPLRARFGIVCDMIPYSVDELTLIAVTSAEKMNLPISHNAVRELAKRSLGTPRILNRILRRVQDYASYHKRDLVDQDFAKWVCATIGIDSLGLNANFRKYLDILMETDKPVSQNILTSKIGESKDLIEEVIEPTLLKFGFIEISPKGRIITTAGLSHMLEPVFTR